MHNYIHGGRNGCLRLISFFLIDVILLQNAQINVIHTKIVNLERVIKNFANKVIVITLLWDVDPIQIVILV